jgi:5,5'-dehydrodivanillate O-demethylase
MGRLLRSFWQPVARSSSVGPGQARALNIMSEELTLYRGESGQAHLLAGRCAHRGSVLQTGWVQGEDIRCMYHGWRYDPTGRCVEIPAEKRPRTHEIRVDAFPVHEYCGLVFAYLGQAPAPEFDLPRKHFLEEPGRNVFVREQMWDCNWFQTIENSLDAVHVSFVHVWGKFSRFGQELTTAIPELSYSETSAGIRQVATRSSGNVRMSNWTFPNNNHIINPGPKKGDPWSDVAVWGVPIDEHHTMRFLLHAFPASATDMIREFGEDPHRDYTPVNHYRQLFNDHVIPDVSDSQVIASQDYVALRGQGIIADRTRENLSSSDAGILFLRKIFLRELDAIAAGQPTKEWRRLADAVNLPTPEQAKANLA